MEFGSERMFRGIYERVTTLSHQGGVKVLLFDDELVLKVGDRVLPSEEVAMRLVKEHTAIPVPEVYLATYTASEVRLAMSVIPGTPLKNIWDNLDDKTKKRVCAETWAIIAKLRCLQKAPELQHLFLCLADGSPCIQDPLVAGANCMSPPGPLLNDDAVRARIHEVYYESNGRKYENELPNMLPRSDASLFSHADIAPHNIMLDEKSFEITGIIDWERAGWYPDYWEYSNIMKPSKYKDWQKWMFLSAPKKWDMHGIMAARAVLF